MLGLFWATSPWQSFANSWGDDLLLPGISRRFVVYAFLRCDKLRRASQSDHEKRLPGSYQQHTFTSLLIFTLRVPTTRRHQHKRERIWKCNMTTFSELHEKYKVSICAIFQLKLWLSVDTHRARSLLHWDRFFANFLLRSLRPSVNHKWSRLPTAPALQKKPN